MVKTYLWNLKYEVCPENIQPCTKGNRDIYWRRYKKHCTQDNDTSVPFQVGTLGSHTVLPTAARCSFCSGSSSHRTNFATCCMPRSCIKISDTVGFGIPRSASCSHTVSCQSSLIAAHTHSTFSGVLLVAGLPGYGSLSRDSWPSLKYLGHNIFTCTAFITSSPKPSESSE